MEAVVVTRKCVSKQPKVERALSIMPFPSNTFIGMRPTLGKATGRRATRRIA